MRKPKLHPEYEINLVGINFMERWNVVQQASKQEILDYISNFNNMKKIKTQMGEESNGRKWWAYRKAVASYTAHNQYLRKLWRTRLSHLFGTDKLYRLDRSINGYETKIGPSSTPGYENAYYFLDTHEFNRLRKGDLLILTNKDELGNLYFGKADDINSAHPYVFQRDNKNLSFIIPLEDI